MLTLLIYNSPIHAAHQKLITGLRQSLNNRLRIEMILVVLQERTLRCFRNENSFLPCVQVTTFPLMVPSLLF